jgi:hypothetical protein
MTIRFLRGLRVMRAIIEFFLVAELLVQLSRNL